MINEINKSEVLPLNPFNYQFVEGEIAVYLHGKTVIYDTDLNRKFDVPIYSNGFNNFVSKLSNGYYSFFNKIYDSEGQLTNIKYKISKKSLEKYNPNKFFDEKSNLLVTGFIKAGFVVVYDDNLKPIKEIQLNKFDVLIHVDFDNKQAFSFNEKTGFITQYSYPEFLEINSYKVNKQNNCFEFSNDGSLFINYGYKPQNSIINLKSGEAKKILFHPTSTKGYKEQYKGPHNFGTGYLKANREFNLIAANTHQNKAIIYNRTEDKLTDLKLHEHFNYDKFEQPLGKYPFGNVIFESNRIIANVGNNLTIWNYDGELQSIIENIRTVRKNESGKYFALINDCLTEIEIL